jgi:hypothetical protein
MDDEDIANTPYGIEVLHASKSRDVPDRMKPGGSLHNREARGWDTRQLAEDNIGRDPDDD